MLAVNWQALLERARPLRLYDLCLARRFAPLGGSGRNHFIQGPGSYHLNFRSHTAVGWGRRCTCLETEIGRRGTYSIQGMKIT